MNPYLTLIPVAAASAVATCFTYNDSLRRSIHYTAVMAIMGMISLWMYYIACCSLDDRERIYIYTAIYFAVDVLVAGSIPLLFFETRAPEGVLLGLVLIVVGGVMVKFMGAEVKL